LVREGGNVGKRGGEAPSLKSPPLLKEERGIKGVRSPKTVYLATSINILKNGEGRCRS